MRDARLKICMGYIFGMIPKIAIGENLDRDDGKGDPTGDP